MVVRFSKTAKEAMQKVWEEHGGEGEVPLPYMRMEMKFSPPVKKVIAWGSLLLIPGFINGVWGIILKFCA